MPTAAPPKKNAVVWVPTDGSDPIVEKALVENALEEAELLRAAGQLEAAIARRDAGELGDLHVLPTEDRTAGNIRGRTLQPLRIPGATGAGDEL